jgi:hypothetical protein
MYWLKVVGAAHWRMEDDWLTNPDGTRTDLLSRVRFSEHRRPSGIARGDKLVYYATGKASYRYRYFAVVRVLSEAAIEENVEEDWPLALDVEPLLVVPRLSLAPNVDDLKLRKGKLSVRTQSHIELRGDQFEVAVQSLADIARA